MKIVIAPNAFKETLSAAEVADTVAQAFRTTLPACQCITVPLADGGDGTVETLLATLGGRRFSHSVTGPSGDTLIATWGLLGDGEVGVVEMAAASGLARVPQAQRKPLHTTSHGTGELIAQTLAHGINTLILGLGGSATVDGGLGMLQALGVRFLDARGEVLRAPLTGGDLLRIADCDASGLDARLRGVTLRVASDVDNPLLGPQGAAAVFGPQKGATPDEVVLLEQGLAQVYGLIERHLGCRVATRSGAGAAGGAGAALMAFLDVAPEPGALLVMELAGFHHHLKGAGLVVTGEGWLDSSTLHGKAPAHVARAARAAGVPVLAVCGGCDEDARAPLGAMFGEILCCPAPRTGARWSTSLARDALAKGLSAHLKTTFLPTRSHLPGNPP